MQYIKGTLDFHITEPAVVTLGKFDGLHLGHKYLLQELEKGKKNGLKTVIFTFDIPPKSIHQNTYKVLSTNKEKEQILKMQALIMSLSAHLLMRSNIWIRGHFF